MVIPISTITLGELQNFAKRQFGDESGVQITDVDIARWVNMGCVEIVSKNKILQASASITGTPNIAAYDLSTIALDMIAIEDVSYGGRSLEQSDNSGIKKLLGTTSSESGVPMYWYTWANSIKLWPVPGTAELLSIDYIKVPPKVSGAGDLLPLPDVYYERIVNFVLAKAYELDEDSTSSANQRRLFEDKLTEMTGMDETRAGTFPIVRDDFEGGYYLGNEDGW
jgi:hypothetical protein